MGRAWEQYCLFPIWLPSVVGQVRQQVSNELLCFGKGEVEMLSRRYFCCAGALGELKAGNERFRTRNMRNCNLLGQGDGRWAVPFRGGHRLHRLPRAPGAGVHQRIGDIFSARIAGNAA